MVSIAARHAADLSGLIVGIEIPHVSNPWSLPLIDMLFGTFRNPPAFAPVQGFWDGASAKVGSSAHVTVRPPTGH